MPNSLQGSLWRKWDLHVHTPLSISQGYGGNTPEAWEKFFQNIESLPPEIKVLGINDYIFIDGYEKVIQAKNSGRLSNIDLVLPVIELRIERFSGADGSLRRLNYHIIFSNDVPPDAIRYQFINALSAEYKLSPEYESLGSSGSRWSGVVTDITSLQELGQWLTNNTPDDKKSSLPSPLDLGFANLNYPIEEIKKRLQHHNFVGKYLTAIGKSEWASMRWDGGGTASKKDLINSVDFVFTAAKTVEDAQKSVEGLKAQEVNSRLLDCSDAHHFFDSDEHMRLGHCFSWIKADTIFEGLKLAAKNYPSRIFIGYEPTKSVLVRNNKTKYIKSLKITKKEGSNLSESWFNTELLFNHDLVVVIGNKGNAKSALTDVLGLCGNTKIKEFSFLNTDRFCDKKNNKASHFDAEICWESGVCKVSCLSDKVDANETELVRYVPQSFFEKVTNEVTASVGGDFDRELKKVIFSHIPESDRLEFEDLDSLLKHHAGLVEASLKRLREKMVELNEEIVELEDKTSDAEIKKLLAQIESQRQVIASHEESKPVPVTQPEGQSQQAQKLEKDREIIETLKVQFEQKKDLLSQAKKRKSVVTQVIGELKQQYDAIENQRNALSQRLHQTGIANSLENILKIDLDVSPLEKIKEAVDAEIQDIERDLDPEMADSLFSTLKHKQEEVRQIQEELNTADRAYQLYVTSQQEWETTKQRLIGSPEEVGSLNSLIEKKRICEEDYPLRLEELKRLFEKPAGT